MANLLLVRTFVRPEWDNTPAFAARAVAAIAAAQSNWPAIDTWSQATTTRARIPLDSRRVPPPDDTAWIRTAANNFSVIGQRWSAIDRWQSGTTTARQKLDARRVPPPDDTAWIRKAANDFSVIGQRWSAIDRWQSGTTVARQKLDARRVPPPDDTPWIRKAANDFFVIGQRWPAIDSWNASTVRPRAKLDPRVDFDDTWIGAAAQPIFTQWAAIEQWLQAGRTRSAPALDPRRSFKSWDFAVYAQPFTQWAAVEQWLRAESTRPGSRLDTRRVPPPDDTSWIAAAASNFNTIGQQWPAIDAWNAVTVRQRREVDPRFVESFDDSGWIGAVPKGFTQWAAIEHWLFAGRVWSLKKGLPFDDADDTAKTWAGYLPTTFSSVDDWQRSIRTRRAIFRDPRYLWSPSDEPWIAQEAIASHWPGIDAWRSDTIRQRREIDPRFVEFFDDAGWLGALQQGFTQWAAIEQWLQSGRTPKISQRDPRYIWMPGDEAWMETPVIAGFWPSIEEWLLATRTRGVIPGRPFTSSDETSLLWAGYLLTTFNAVDAWLSQTARSSPRLDSRRVAPPDDTPWINKAASDFSSVAQQWPGIDTWKSDTVRQRREVDTRFLEFFDDEGWIGALQSFSQWAAIEQWLQADRVRRARPGLPFAGSDDTGLAWAGYLLTTFNAVDAWLQADRARRARPGLPFAGSDETGLTWAGYLLTTFNAVDAWLASTVRTGLRLDARRVPPPDDTAWIANAASLFSAIGQHWPAIDAWSAATIRQHRQIDPRYLEFFDDTGWIGSVQTFKQWAAIEQWLAAQRTPKALRGDPRYAWSPSDEPWIQFEAAAFNTIASHWPAIDFWRSDRVPQRRQLDPRLIEYFDDSGWIGAFNATASLWSSIDAWTSLTVRRGRRLDPRYLEFFDDSGWIGAVTPSAFTQWPAIEQWLQAVRTRAQRRGAPFAMPDETALAQAGFVQTTFSAVDAWLRTDRTRGLVERYPASVLDDLAWIAPNLTPWGGVGSWVMERLRQRSLLYPGYILRPDDVPWQWFAAQSVVPFTPALFTAVRDWLQSRRTSDTRRLWLPSDLQSAILFFPPVVPTRRVIRRDRAEYASVIASATEYASVIHERAALQRPSQNTSLE